MKNLCNCSQHYFDLFRIQLSLNGYCKCEVCVCVHVCVLKEISATNFILKFISWLRVPWVSPLPAVQCRNNTFKMLKHLPSVSFTINQRPINVFFSQLKLRFVFITVFVSDIHKYLTVLMKKSKFHKPSFCAITNEFSAWTNCISNCWTSGATLDRLAAFLNSFFNFVAFISHAVTWAFAWSKRCSPSRIIENWAINAFKLSKKTKNYNYITFQNILGL